MNLLPLPGLASHASSGIVYLTDDAVCDACGVRIAFTGRHGGASEPPFETLNLGSHVGDSLQDVEANRARVLNALVAPPGCELVTLNQVHGTRVLEVRPHTPLDDVRAEGEAGADGIVVASDARGVAPLLCFADCVPLIFVAPDGTFAVAHAGWRGVMGRIAEQTVRGIVSLSGVGPSEVNVYIGPHIRSCCFEVSDELAAEFGEQFGSAAVPHHRHVDLSAALRVTLMACGVAPARICDAGVCTACTVEDFYSYRAEDGHCGRHGALAFREEG